MKINLKYKPLTEASVGGAGGIAGFTGRGGQDIDDIFMGGFMPIDNLLIDLQHQLVDNQEHREFSDENTPVQKTKWEELETNLGMSLEDFETENLFIPGVGTPYAMITPEAMLINIEKAFPDKSLTIDINAFLDAADGDGRLLSIEAEYELESGVELGLGITKIYGDDKIENYNFNNMESFSSFRSRLTYYF